MSATGAWKHRHSFTQINFRAPPAPVVKCVISGAPFTLSLFEEASLTDVSGDSCLLLAETV